MMSKKVRVMMMPWSKQQALAIELTGKNITVSAGAGAGKTAVLIARLTKRIIDDQISVENILAITFTEAAASEIKKRLTKSLAKAYLDQPTTYLQKQLALLASANISTIHSFCLYIIKNYYYVLQLDKAVTANILDPTMAQYYQNQAVDKAINELLYDTSGFYELYRLNNGNDIQLSNIKATIIELANAALATTDHNLWLDKCLTNYETKDDLNKLTPAITDIFWQMIQAYFKIYFDALKQLQSVVDDNESLLAITLRIQHAQLIAESIRQRDYPQYLTQYQANVEMKITLNNGPQGKEPLRKAEKAFQDICEKLFTQDVFLKDLSDLYPAASILIKLTKNYINIYQTLKLDNKLMDFDDMERYALAILRSNNAFVAQELATHFSDILVDEYQDTNTIQDTIINLISRGNNVFRVGDIKQSIYRFRKARPAIMQALIDYPGNNDEVIYLSNNYRSKKMIIDFNNALFDQLMNVEGLNNRYLLTDAGVYGTDDQTVDTTPVEIHMLDLPEDEDKKRDKKQIKADYIAYKIKELHDVKHVPYSNICVLVTTHLIKDTIRIELERRNIPVYGKGSAGLFKSRGVLALLNYLRLIDDPTDQTALLSVLVSFYGFTDDQLAILALNDRNLLKSLNDQHLNIYQEIQTTINLKAEVTLYELVSKLLLINDYYELLNNQQQKANIDLLFETIAQYQKTSGSITDFLRLVDTLQTKDLNEAMALSEDDDAVKIMTIHQSKGLQFQHVFFFSIDRVKTNNQSSSLIKVSTDIGFGLPVSDRPYRLNRPNIISLAINEYERKEDLEERIRVLYVALTRAQDRLYIIDHLPTEINPLTLTSFNHRNYTTWINQALLNIPDHLYQLIIVNEPWQFDSQVTYTKEKVIYPRYQLTTSTKGSLSPSSTETRRDNFDLDLDERIKADQLGTKVHQLFEDLPNTHWSEQMINDLLDQDTMQYFDSLYHFSNSEIYKQVLTMTIKKEVPFVIKDDQGFVHGLIDLLAINEAEAIIIDFKTDRNVSASDLIDRYQKQIALYQKAIATIYPQIKIKAYLYALTLKDFIDITNH